MVRINERNNIVALMKIAVRVDVPMFKKFRDYCDKWMEGENPLLRRAGYLALLFLVQGRGQVVKGDIPRIVSVVMANLPKTVEDLREMEVNDEVMVQTTETGELNLYSREDGKKIDSMIRSSGVGDEEVNEGSECSLYGVSISSTSRYVDWYILILLLNELYAHFPEPVHECLRTTSILLNEVSILLVSHHFYARVVAMQFFQEYLEKELVQASFCDSDCWLTQSGSVFLLLQRLFILFHMPHSIQSLSLQSNLLTALLCAFSEHSIPPPEGMKSGLPTVSEGGVMKRLQAINSVRQLYSLEDIEESENGHMSEEEDEEDEENDSEEEADVQNHLSDSSEEESGTEKQSRPNRPFKTMRRIPNPYRIIDALYILGSILTLHDIQVKKSVLTIFETICAFLPPAQIEENIVYMDG